MTMAIKKVVALVGSLQTQSANLRLMQEIESLATGVFEISYYEALGRLPHFNPDLDTENPPPEVVAFRQRIAAADGVLIFTPEYIFSLPGSLKNALEWCFSTTHFSGKPVALVTASASGRKGHDELRATMKTLEASFTDDTLLLVQDITGKFAGDGARLVDPQIIAALMQLIFAFDQQLDNQSFIGTTRKKRS